VFAIQVGASGLSFCGPWMMRRDPPPQEMKPCMIRTASSAIAAIRQGRSSDATAVAASLIAPHAA
jgi:hypothetical protein